MSNYTLNEYQKDAAKTAEYPEVVAMDYLVAGLCAEAGEVAGKWAKYLRVDHQEFDEFAERVKPEIGDVLWFCAALCDELGTTLEDVAKANIAKLADRQKRGKIKGSGDER